MTTYFSHPGYYQHPSYLGKLTSQPHPAATAGRPPAAVMPTSYIRTLRSADRGCCCTARPAVVALLPATASRPHRTDLMLCMHHYRASRQGLARAGATVIDETGHVLAEPGAPSSRLE
jgi:hypothetical protein